MPNATRDRFLALLGLLAAVTAPAAAQTTAPDRVPDGDRAPTVSPVNAEHARDTAPLLRERSFLADLTGQLVADERTGWWRFEADPGAGGEPGPTLIMLPNRKLDEMQQVVRSSPQERIVFRVTGQVFVYRGHNFLLPTHAPQLVEFDRRPAAAPDDPTPDPAPGDALDTQVAEEDRGDTVEDIMSELAAAAGPIHRSAASTTRPEADDITTAPPAHEGEIMVARRGHLTRTERGAWMFVFAADAEGLGDPPLIILPCLLLERMERHAARTSRAAPILLSGQVYQYRGRGFVLPTVFRVPNERTRLTP